ncbi:MAG TPA: hypothetical protein VE973_00510, partial [Candidatus Limnocylindria bacterium]|nr:hypothetical protein [Candidatus Limnocylindria bacterium]
MQSETTKNYLTNLLNQASLKLGFDNFTITITVPEPRFGDYASNAALVLGKQLKKNPAEVASAIISELKKLDEKGVFESIEPAGGFINFKLSQNYLLKNLQNILEQGDLFGCSIIGEGK